MLLICHILIDIQGSFCGMVIIISKLKNHFPNRNTSRLWGHKEVSCLTHFGFVVSSECIYVYILFSRYSLVYRPYYRECGLYLVRIFFISNTGLKLAKKLDRSKTIKSTLTNYCLVLFFYTP